MRTKVLMCLAFVAISIGVYGVLNPPQKNDLEKLQNIVEQQPNYFIVNSVTEDVTRGMEVAQHHIKTVRMLEDDAKQLGIYESKELSIPIGTVFINDITEDSYIAQSDLVTPKENGYVDAILEPGYVPYPIKVGSEIVVGGLVHAGSKIDVLAITKPSEGYSNTQISIEPILTEIKVLQVKSEVKPAGKNTSSQNNTSSHLILELTRKQVAQLTIAKKIAQIEVHKSIGEYTLNDLSANAGDVLPNFKAIKEFRANKVTVK
ncbi:Flp pilus assembly protein CpaB [Vibrio agarivorans]|uniref:Flp pilus assembly protein CpaB n=1 Tax=Vibrio agarivorans TaxID=153622 RepID=A0ABT7Y6Q3_9VIBR|nr:Flp pilus assembly protein CpaB [Vibrio agarivorans]MDN2483732.1 Flp pilus assembly protein CpaB [Vibrio agarivorans]